MRNMLARFKSKKGHACRQAGFTLIELLVVIGIMGILAAALVSIVDPVEQLNKARDNGLRVKARTYVNALASYYATNSVYPWDVSTTDPCVPPTTETALSVAAQSGAAADSCINILIASGELKSSYLISVNTTTGDGAKLFVRSAASPSTTVVICYAPSSKGERISVSSIFGTNCASGGTTLDDEATPIATCNTQADRQDAAAGTCFQRQKI